MHKSARKDIQKNSLLSETNQICTKFNAPSSMHHQGEQKQVKKRRVQKIKDKCLLNFYQESKKLLQIIRRFEKLRVQKSGNLQDKNFLYSCHLLACEQAPKQRAGQKIKTSASEVSQAWLLSSLHPLNIFHLQLCSLTIPHQGAFSQANCISD